MRGREEVKFFGLRLMRDRLGVSGVGFDMVVVVLVVVVVVMVVISGV